jgi:hypothetical protein
MNRDIKINYNGLWFNIIFTILLVHKLIGIMFMLPTLSWLWVFSPLIINCVFTLVCLVFARIFNKNHGY